MPKEDRPVITLGDFDEKHGLPISWREGKSQEKDDKVSLWQLRVGTLASNGGMQWEILDEDFGKEDKYVLPTDDIPLNHTIYIQVEGTIDGKKDKKNDLLPTTIFSDKVPFLRDEGVMQMA